MSLTKIRASVAELSRIENGLSPTSFRVNSFLFVCSLIAYICSEMTQAKRLLKYPWLWFWFDTIQYALCGVLGDSASSKALTQLYCHSDQWVLVAVRSARATEVFWIPIWFKENHTTALVWRSSVSSSSTTNFRFRASCLLSINNITNVSSIKTKEKTANPKPMARWYWKGGPSWVIQVKKLSITKKPEGCYMAH